MRIIILTVVNDDQDLKQFRRKLLYKFVFLPELAGNFLNYHCRFLHLGLALLHLLFTLDLRQLHV